LKFVLGLIVLAVLTAGTWAFFAGREADSDAVSLTQTEMPDLSEVARSDVEVTDRPAKTVLEIVTETPEEQSSADKPKVEVQTELNIEVLDRNGDALAGGGSNKVQKALENVLGGSTVLGAPSTGETAAEDLASNLEHDAIKSETWDQLEEALTVDGFNGLAISHALLGPRVDEATKKAIKSLVTVGEENPEQIQSVVSEIRKLLGLSSLGE